MLENSGDTQLVFGTEKALVAKLNGPLNYIIIMH